MTPIQQAMLKAGLIKKTDIETIIAETKEQSEFASVDFESKIETKVSEKKESPKVKEKKKEYFQCLACGRPSEDEVACAYCGGDVVEVKDVPKLKGHMVWFHKTAPTFQFDDKPTLKPEDFARNRRR